MYNFVLIKIVRISVQHKMYIVMDPKQRNNGTIHTND